MAEITLEKTLSGAGASAYRGADFAYEARCTIAGEPLELAAAGGQLRPGQPVVIGRVPWSSQCTFTETDTGGAELTTVNGNDGTSLDLTITSDTSVRFNNQFGDPDGGGPDLLRPKLPATGGS